jgi:hypothetical protein
MFTDLERAMICGSLRERASRCRHLANSRRYAGPSLATARAGLRDEAGELHALADKITPLAAREA